MRQRRWCGGPWRGNEGRPSKHPSPARQWLAVNGGCGCRMAPHIRRPTRPVAVAVPPSAPGFWPAVAAGYYTRCRWASASPLTVRHAFMVGCLRIAAGLRFCSPWHRVRRTALRTVLHPRLPGRGRRVRSGLHRVRAACRRPAQHAAGAGHACSPRACGAGPGACGAFPHALAAPGIVVFAPCQWLRFTTARALNPLVPSIHSFVFRRLPS